MATEQRPLDDLLDEFHARRINRRQLVQAAAALGVSASALGGALTAKAGRAAGAQSAQGVLQIGRESEFAQSFSPFNGSTGTQTQLFDLIYSRLLKVSADLSFVPDAAESYEVSPDATQFTFHIRQGMTWHDGEPFTAKDIIFSYKLATTKAVAAKQYGKLSQIKGAAAFNEGTADDVAGLELLDDNTVRMTLEKPNVAFLIGTAASNSLIWILPEHIFKDADPAALEQHPAIQKPTVGSAAYQFVEYVPDQYLSFKANPNFYLGAPKIEQAFIRLAEPATQLAQLESGELHMVSRMAPKEANRLKTSDVVDIVSTPGVGVFQTAIFTEKVKDKRVRQAMMYAVDRKGLLDVVLMGEGELVNSTVIGPAWATYDDLNTYDHDPEKAKALLKEAGWDSSQSLRLTWAQGFQAVELAAPVFQQQLAEVGIKIELTPLETGAYVDKVVNNPDFDLAWFGGGSYRLDPDVSSSYYMCANFTPNGGNTTHYCNEDLDALFVEGRGTTDIAKRTGIYHEVAKTLNEDIPTIFWWSDNQIFGISKKLQGVKPGPNQYIWWNIQEWSFAE
jgi:peptide/nickel transport system substrate-binding protein